ncbi:unnamed protein product [Effrenium voratum]|nr:unnamed protein product [Effrenium voratum]
MSRPDRLYISPELAAFFTAAHYEAWFADHGALHGVFQIPDNHPSYWAWPLPAQLPWEEADIQTWHASFQPSLNDTQPTLDPTSHYKHLGYLYETSLDHHLSEHSHIRLPPACLGRGQRLQPVRRQPQAPILRSSRPGEEHLASDVISRAVLRWFRQLRRLQSMHHALKAGGQGPTHQLYRTELWHAILHAPGFQPTFCEWWPTRKHQFQGSPPHLPLYAPSLDLMHNIYNDFRYNFRSFESWNLRQKSKCNQARLQQHHHRIFKAIKPAMREPMDRLVEKHTVAILAVSADGTQIHTDASLESRPHATWWVDGTPATVKQLSQDTFEVESDLLLVKGQQLHQHHHLSSESQIHSTLEQFWQKRWSKHADLPQEAWKRIFGFVKAYETFLDMFQLSIDLDKTYLWAVHPRDRQQLGLLKHRTSLKDKDLGGHMTYGPRRRIFHSAPIEDFSLQLIKQLRTAAVRALGHGNAGASPAIRLSLLQGNILADPGFYQLWHVVRTFRRMLLKQAALLDMWHQFQASFDGHFYAGPFSVLIRQLNAVSWKIEAPPYLTDHDGLQHNILTIDHHYFRSILEDAWRQRVALDAFTRTDLQGLRGINWPACRHLGAHHTALQSAQICALREGAFYLNTHKAKYDCFISELRSHFANDYFHLAILTTGSYDTHVFSDGTCTSPTYSPLSLAAIGIPAASSWCIIQLATASPPRWTWLAHWNNVADYAAKEANRRHSEEFHTLWNTTYLPMLILNPIQERLS